MKLLKDDFEAYWTPVFFAYCLLVACIIMVSVYRFARRKQVALQRKMTAIK